MLEKITIYLGWLVLLGFYSTAATAAGIPGALPVSNSTPAAQTSPETQPTLSPTPLASASPTPTAMPLPTAAPSTITAPQWAPAEASFGGKSAALPKKTSPSPWESLTDVGVVVPVNSQLQGNYGAGFNVDLGGGVELDSHFSFWLDLDISHFDAKNPSNTNGTNFTMVGLASLFRYRPLDSGFSPYIFAGPGLAYNENRSDTTSYIDVVTGYTYFPVTSYEIDFLAEGGFGLDWLAAKGLHVYLQGKLTYDGVSSSFGSAGNTGAPMLFLPIDAGVIFGF